MLTKIQGLPYPISKDEQGVYWMSNKDITKALGYKTTETIKVIARKHPKEFTEPSSVTHFTIGAVRTICKYSRHTNKARQLSGYLLKFARQQTQVEGGNDMLKKIESKPYPIYQDDQGSRWMSSPDLVKLFKYSSHSAIVHVIERSSNPGFFTERVRTFSNTRFYNLEAVSRLCQRIETIRPWVKDLSDHLKTFSKPATPISYKKIAEDLGMVVAHSKTPASSAIQFIIQEKGIKNPVDWIKDHGYPTQIGEFNVEYLDFKYDWDNIGKSPEYQDGLKKISDLSKEIKKYVSRRHSLLLDQLCDTYGYLLGLEALAAFTKGSEATY